ncbi:MAG: hypothetical protein LKE30_05940 [Bacteroidales bacterium]|jgi:hypothetical protein|nr:hypothetical protein [Bacteroidales bacterium]
MKKSKFKLLLLFIGLVAIAGTTLSSCNDDDNHKTNNTGISFKINYDSGCKNSTKDDGNTYLFHKYVNGDTLFIEKINYMYACGIYNLVINSYISTDTLYITEHWQGGISVNCLCQRDLSYNIFNIPSGQYVVKSNILYQEDSNYLYMKDSIFNISIQ